MVSLSGQHSLIGNQDPELMHPTIAQAIESLLPIHSARACYPRFFLRGIQVESLPLK